MIEPNELLDIRDALNLYLVANKLKPASRVYIDPRSPRLENRVVVEEEFREKVRYNTFKLNPKDIEVFRENLVGLGMASKDWENELVTNSWDYEGNQRDGTISRGQIFYVGVNSENLKRLLSAKEDEEFGRALGFPEEAITAFQKIIDGERRDGSYISVSLARAKKAGLELPTWLAYICFVPENLDFVNDNISPTTEALARKYQDFVQKHNPTLAGRVETDFLERKLPDSWEQMPHGGYSVIFEFQPSSEK